MNVWRTQEGQRQREIILARRNECETDGLKLDAHCYGGGDDAEDEVSMSVEKEDSRLASDLKSIGRNVSLEDTCAPHF